MSSYRKRSMPFGQWIRDIRRQLGYSQQQVANNVAGLNQSEVSRIETQGWVPPVAVISDLCGFLGLSLEEAQSYITSNSLSGILQRRCKESQDQFCKFINSYAKQFQDMHLLVIRDSSQPWDGFRKILYPRLLALSDRLMLSIVFTEEHRFFENSFVRFRGILGSHLGQDIAKRIRGFQPRFPKVNCLPMHQPISLFLSGYDCAAIRWSFTPEVLEAQPEAPGESFDSLYIEYDLNSSFAKTVTDYMGIIDTTEIDSSRWQEIGS